MDTWHCALHIAGLRREGVTTIFERGNMAVYGFALPFFVTAFGFKTVKR